MHLPAAGVEVTQVDEHHFQARPVLRHDRAHGGPLQDRLRRLGARHVGDIVRIE
ncbi:MAG: hypothetical protein R3A48_01905 [Polyangiales bacterium]